MLHEGGPTYKFGTFEINAADRVLLDKGEMVALRPKAADLLLLLVSRPGHVFTKQELLAALWPDSFVEETSISRNIADLRRALSDNADHPQFIETIPKRGYRWIAEVVQVGDAGENRDTRSPSPRSSMTRRRVAVPVAIGCVLVAVLAYALLRPAPENSASLEVHPFTTYGGGEYEPAFSPDGRTLAFVWNGEEQRNYEVYVRTITSENVTRITSDSANKASPRWSRDGNSIAFLRSTADGADSGVYVIELRTGAIRKITPTFPVTDVDDGHLDWSPAADDIAVVDKVSAEQPFAIYLVNVATGQRRRLTNPPPGSRGDTGPVFSRDGRLVAFRRTVTAAVNDLFVVPAAGGEPTRITFDNQYTAGLAWSADGKSLVFASKRPGGPALWRVPASGGTPSKILSGFAQFLAVAPAGDRLAYSQWVADTNIWRIDMLDQQASPDRPLIASTRADMSPQYSPNGYRIAFRSDRSGTDEIWVSDSEGRNPHQVTNGRGPLTGSPRWSPDAARIAFDSRPEGRSHIFALAATGGDADQITTGTADDVLPSWSHDGRSIYFASNRSGTWQVWKVAADAHHGSDGAVQVTHDGGFAAFEAEDRQYVYYAKGEHSDGLWRVSAAGKEEVVVPELKAGLWGQWALRGREMYFIDAEHTGPATLVMLDTASGRKTRLRRLPKLPVWYDSGFAVSPDGRWALYAQADSSGSDIFLVEHFR